MTTNRRKKVVKYRGSQTHGGGAKKKRRGAGHRGGRGLAGSGKRAHHQKQRIFQIYGKDYFGRKGFFNPNVKVKTKAVNILSIEENLQSLLKNKLITEKDGFIHVELKKLGYNKLLSAGKPTKKYKIVAQFSTKKAQEKIKSAGGEIVS